LSQKCLLRVQKLLAKSNIDYIKQDEIINQIKIAQAEQKLTTIDEINVDKVAKDVSAKLKLQKQINKRNAIENEIKGRSYVEYVMENFNDDPAEGLRAILVGSNRNVKGARDSVALTQETFVKQLIVGFNEKLREANVEGLFESANKQTQRRIVRTMYELNQKIVDGTEPKLTEKNADIIKLATVLEEYSELIRTKLNDRGANIDKLWGYIVRQSHDPYLVRDAAARLGKKDIEIDQKYSNKYDENYQRNFQAWKEFTLDKLDTERTFADVDDIDEFMLFAYNSLVRNENVKSTGTEFTYNARQTKDVQKSAKMKRVLHFKDADNWFDYNDMFGMSNLNESIFSGMQTAGRNIGIMDTLGTRPNDNFEKIRKAVATRLVAEGRDSNKVSSSKFNKFLAEIDGSVFTVEGFALAKYSAITRGIQSLAKLGGAVISATTDLGIYATEMKHQGRGFFSGMFEALNSLARIKNTKQKKLIAEGLGFIADNAIYDVAGRYQVGDQMSKGWTKTQRTFFKYNLLSWWTNTLKEGAMLGMANYFAKQKAIKFNDLNPDLRNLFETYNINETSWNVIRKFAIEKADDGKEFINIKALDNITDGQVRLITGQDNMSAREIAIARDRFKASVSGMLLDRSIYAVIEPDARVRASLRQGTMAGTYMGEAIRFFGQFKAFPFAIVQKVVGRELANFKGPNKNIAKGLIGISSLYVTATLLGYVAMTAKDLLKGRSPRDPFRMTTFFAAMMQGGGLGIYGDVLFSETRDGAGLLYATIGPGYTNLFDILAAVKDVMRGEPDKAGRKAYRVVSQNIPFLNLFYIKTAFDYMIGYQMLETINPGVLKRVENRMEKEYGQEYLITKPSAQFSGF
jgi:hypothetical protein